MLTSWTIAGWLAEKSVFLKRSLPPLEGDLPEKLQFDYIDRFGAFWALFGIKADLVTFGKTFKAAALDGRMVDKYISIVFSSNEAKTLAVVEPLHCSLCHFVYLLVSKLKSQKNSIKKATKLKVFGAFCELKNL
jgi:hypothetical protein